MTCASWLREGNDVVAIVVAVVAHVFLGLRGFFKPAMRSATRLPQFVGVVWSLLVLFRAPKTRVFIRVVRFFVAQQFSYRRQHLAIYISHRHDGAPWNIIVPT